MEQLNRPAGKLLVGLLVKAANAEGSDFDGARPSTRFRRSRKEVRSFLGAETQESILVGGPEDRHGHKTHARSELKGVPDELLCRDAALTTLNKLNGKRALRKSRRTIRYDSKGEKTGGEWGVSRVGEKQKELAVAGSLLSCGRDFRSLGT